MKQLINLLRKLITNLASSNTKVLGVNRYTFQNKSLVDMSEAHLSKGSVEPPKVEGLLRLYSMKFCPYAQRARLVLNAKGIPHDTVNINLIEKPEWYLKVHPEGKVPAIDTGSQVIVESLDIADWLDETYPDKPLYPSDPAAKQKDKDLIQKIGPLTSVFAKCVFNLEKEEKTPEQWLEEFKPHLEILENELKSRGSFFGGNAPGMVDYMLWPWAERAACIGFALKARLPLKEGEFPLVRQWRKEMRKQPAVESIYNEPERFWKIAQAKLNGTMPEYDTV